MTTHPVIADMNRKMAKAIEHTLHEFNTLHTGKASPSMVENIMVDVYGGSMRLRDIAAITTPDPRLIQIQPWDKSAAQPIQKAIQQSNVGINPTIDGAIIRLPIPEMSRERRQEFVKVTHRMAEDGRVSVRHTRRDAIDALKKEQKAGNISEDDLKRLEKEVQQVTDKTIKSIDEHMAHKEKELMSM